MVSPADLLSSSQNVCIVNTPYLISSQPISIRLEIYNTHSRCDSLLLLSRWKIVLNNNKKQNKTRRTLGLAITSTWSTSLRWGAGSLACSLDCNMFAAPLNMKPPPISRTELYIFRLVSSVAVKNKKFNFGTGRRWTEGIFIKWKMYCRNID